MKRKIAFCLFGIFICVGFSVIAETPVMALDDTSEQHAENITNILKASGLKKVSNKSVRNRLTFLLPYALNFDEAVQKVTDFLENRDFSRTVFL